jgi:hypothetical protein
VTSVVTFSGLTAITCSSFGVQFQSLLPSILAIPPVLAILAISAYPSPRSTPKNKDLHDSTPGLTSDPRCPDFPISIIRSAIRGKGCLSITRDDCDDGDHGDCMALPTPVPLN